MTRLDARTLSFTPPRNLVNRFRGLALLGAAVTLAGALAAPGRLWAHVLLAGVYVAGLGLAGVLFVAIHSVTGAGWATVLRRVPEALAGLIPAGSALVLLAVTAGAGTLYPFLPDDHGGAHLSAFQETWFQPAFFVGRSLAYVVAWVLLAALLLALSRRQDADGDPAYTRRAARLSAAFLVVFGVTIWLASSDWIMALEPGWYSTIFGVYQFSGLFLAGLAAIVVLTVRLRRSGPLAGLVTRDHLHDLGKLLFAFSTFWMYIGFSQYMLIWYGNIPEEAVWYARRMAGGWAPLFWANVLLNWVVPFFVLLPRATKRNEKILYRVALVVLVGRWLDLYLLIGPPVVGPTPVFGVWEAGVLLGAFGLAGFVFLQTFRRAPVVPHRDPRLGESLRSHA
jgi:hypothetical protein